MRRSMNIRVPAKNASSILLQNIIGSNVGQATKGNRKNQTPQEKVKGEEHKPSLFKSRRLVTKARNAIAKRHSFFPSAMGGEALS
jgi:hypothetical protein